MNEISVRPELEDVKAQARRLRAALADQGRSVSHSESLELLAQQMGHRNWNTLRAATAPPRANRPGPPVHIGERVRGTYLGQAFAGRVIALCEVDSGAYYHLTLQFDAPVDVVRFESFSSMRSRVRALVTARGVSPARTSDGKPHLKLDL